MQRRALLAGLGLTTLGLFPSARALAGPLDDPHVVVGAVAGIGTHVGAAGGILELWPVSQVGLDAGIGATTHGARFGGGARFVPLRGTVALGLGVHVSAGPYAMSTEHYPCLLGCAASYVGQRRWDRAVWTHVDLSLEGELGSALVWRALAGVAWINNVGASTCDDRACDYRPAPILIVGGEIALAWSLKPRKSE